MTTEIDAEGLAACPFCGTTEHLSLRRVGSNIGAGTPFAVLCHHLDCEDVRGPVQYGMPAAIAAWNRRATTRTSEAEPVAFRHEMIEPDREPFYVYSGSSANPWSHWMAEYLGQCTYSCQPLYTLPTPASDDQVEAAAEAICRATYLDWDSLPDSGPDDASPSGKETKEMFRIWARAALAAMGSTKP